MSLLKVVVSLSAVFVLVSASFALAKDALPASPTVVKVGNIAVSQQDLDQELQKLIPMSYSVHGGVKPETLERLRGEARQNLIVRAYKVQYAIDEEIALDPGALESAWQKFKDKNAGKLNEIPASYLSEVRANIYLSLLARKAESEAVDKFVIIDDADVKQYYQENEELYVQPKLYEASHVFVKVDPSSNKEERALREKRAYDIYERAKKGEDFYNLAYYESDDRSRYVGGKLGSFHAGQTVAEFDKALQKMQPEEISEPILTRFGYHVIRLDSVIEKHKLSYDDAALRIKSKMKKKMRQKLYDEWLTRLRNKYPVQQYEQ